jgi:hypothetical protein
MAGTMLAVDAAKEVAALVHTPVLRPLTEATDAAVAEWVDEALNAWERLSGGERVLAGVVRFVWNGTGTVGLDDLATLDQRTASTVIGILRARFGWTGPIGADVAAVSNRLSTIVDSMASDDPDWADFHEADRLVGRAKTVLARAATNAARRGGR